MNRVTNRAWIMLVFILALVGGMTFFVGEYFLKSEQWVLFTGSPHVYEQSSIGTVVVSDRDGTVLLDTTDGRVYAEDAAIRQATLHWMGDRQGNISTQVVGHYTKEVAGYDQLNGVYTYGAGDSKASLTLSSRVQTVALEAMAGRKGTVAVYNYKTGEILCAVSTPVFDPDNVPDIYGDTTGAYEGIFLNRFVQSAYIPGSIFKVVTTAAALDSVPNIMDQTFTCTGVYQFGIDRVTCETAHGTLNLKTALTRSCNCSFAQIAQLIGKDTMMKYVEQYQITQSVSFDGITTVRGNYDVTRAAPVQLAWSCIGQHTDQINPCRYMTFMGAIAGGGAGAEPYMVSRISVGEDVTYEAQTKLGTRIMSEELAATMQEFMRNNVVNNYGAEHFPGLTVCAKSGTSELGGGKAPNAMFTGFVMDENYPLAFIVVVENGGYGSAICVPIISKVLAECKNVLDGVS